MATTKQKDKEQSDEIGQRDDQQRGTADHGVAGATTGTNTGVPADRSTVDPHSEEGKRQREARDEAGRGSVGGPIRDQHGAMPPSDGDQA